MMAALRSTPADVLLIDYALGCNDIDGLNLIRALRVRFPDSRILVSSSHDNPATTALALKAGAAGFVGKSRELGELVQVIRQVASGPPQAGAVLAPDGSPAHGAALSPREQEVLRCCLDGMSVTQIAAKFSRSVKTISGQKQAALRKLGVRNDSELFKMRGPLANLQRGLADGAISHEKEGRP
jgi:DNA-binding NarL/FixJ family response regulator